MKCEICKRQNVKIVKGLCPAHYQRLRKGISLEDPLKGQYKNEFCEVLECIEPRFAYQFCKNHYRKYKFWGNASIGKSKGKYLKNKTINKNGYVCWYDPESIHASRHGRVYEHRYVMGESIGRSLYDHENVHHKNGDRSDNRLENLELWSKSQPPGQSVKDKLTWAYEIISLYKDYK